MKTSVRAQGCTVLAGPGKKVLAGSGTGQWRTYDVADGLADPEIERSIVQDWEGYLWFATDGGASRYDGERFTTFTTEDGLAHDWVISVFQDREGDLWFGTGGGASRYDGQGWITFTTQEGLADNQVSSILQDREGYLWFGTYGGGVSRYDGQVFQTLDHRDGLAGNEVTWVMQDCSGYLWFATLKGVTRYRPMAPAPFPVYIDAVVAEQRYAGRSEVTVPSSARLVAFEFHGISFKTRPGAMIYRYRLEGYEAPWQTTRQGRVEYQDLKPGNYTFQVQAIDRDLVYSEPATVKLTVVPDPHIEGLSEVLRSSGGEFVGTSPALRQVQGQLEEVAHTEVVVLILGETGTGKGLAARAVHAMSPRKAGPFIPVNCGAIPEGLVESELFGHERGAFTGALSRKLGKVELAKGGTLFLDEIGDLALEAQVKLLDVLEEGTFERVGGTELLRADIRVIAATNRDLRQMVEEGRFREDLYFRLQGFAVRMPPLRERQEDIPLLAAYFAGRMGAHLNKGLAPLSAQVLARLETYEWRGNVRELEHVMQRAVIVCRGGMVRVEDIVLEFGEEEGGLAEILTLAEQERRYLQEVLERTGWVLRGPRGAAALLGVPESTLRSRMKKLGIRRR
ncbi:MAG: sigma 54-interacting transcriptional regulator [Candidatus Latescibacteria bacterium]|nr:sigma 54-interacting transcriptional regulator [Candidatus Latescibacterota bacterium]